MAAGPSDVGRGGAVGRGAEVMACLEERGASFLPDILAGVARLPSRWRTRYGSSWRRVG